MSALKLILLILFTVNNTTAFKPIATTSEGIECCYYCTQDDNNESEKRVLNISNLKTESFLPRCNSQKAKVKWPLGKRKNSLSVTKKKKVGLLYLHFSKTINLKLPSFSISYPFQYFT